MEEICLHAPDATAAAAPSPKTSRRCFSRWCSTSKTSRRSAPNASNLTSRASIVRLLALAAILGLFLLLLARAAEASTKTTGTTTTTTTTTTNSTQQVSASKVAPSNKSAPSSNDGATKSSSLANVGNLDSQSSDLSSMYVQIPIAEPEGGGSASGDQQQRQMADSTGDASTGDANSSDSSKASTWTGPWPKKFQIGYIKQSDLHQVLIESLKNDPFLGSSQQQQKQQSTSGSATGKTSSSSSSSSAPVTPAPITVGVKSAPPPATTHQPPVQATKSTAGTVAQAPPSDASSLMQSVGYPQLKAVQQSSLATMYGQQPRQQQSMAPGSSYGRLASPQVLPRPTLSLPQAGRGGNLYQPIMQQQQQQHMRNQQHFMQQAPMLNQFRGNQHQNLHQHGQHHQQNGGQFHQHHHNQHQGNRNNNGHRSYQQQQQPKLLPMAHNFMQQQQQQFQFASYPNQFKNQPIYTMNNFPSSSSSGLGQAQQQIIDADQLQLIQMANGRQATGNKPAKSDHYHSSWRPVQSSDSSDASIPNDGFDDGFGMPAQSGTEGSSGGGDSSMNKHPVLNSYLGSGGGGGGKASPAKMIKQQQQTGKISDPKTTQARQLPEGTKSAQAGATKGFTDQDSQQRNQEGGTKSGTERRALAGNGTATTTTTTTTTTPSPGDPTTVGSADSSNATTTLAPGSSTASTVATTTTISSAADGSAQNNQTMLSGEAETTTDPESEIIDSGTTEASEPEEATTTASSVTTESSLSASGSRSSTSQPSTNGNNNSGESEVVTQNTSGQSVPTGTFPAVQSADDSTSSSTPTPMAGSSSSTTTTTTTQSSREETTPSSNNSQTVTTGAPATSSTTPSETKGGGDDSEVEGGSTTSATGDPAAAAKTDASMSDEALMAAAQRASDLTKSRSTRQGPKNAPPTSTTKKARSSERLQQQQQVGGSSTTTTSTSATQVSGRKTSTASNGNKLITRKPAASSQRAAKQIQGTGTASGVKGGVAQQQTPVLATNARQLASASQTKESLQKTNGKKLASAKSQQSNSTATSRTKSGKFTRMTASQSSQRKRSSERLQQATQVVSMSAAQAQSAAQTLASLLLSRCLSSTNCAHLLDVCSTKQAAVPFGGGNTSNNNLDGINSDANSTSGNTSAAISAAWSMPVGLMSQNLMSLMQALQADRALSLFPAWKDAIENVVDQEAQTGYTLIMPSNEAIDRMPVAQVDALLTNGEQMSQLIENHILDSAETIDLPASSSGGSSLFSSTSGGRGQQSSQSQRRQTRYIKSKGLQINQHRDRMVTINGKRVVYANQQAPGGRIHVIDGVLDWPSHNFGSSGGGGSALAAGSSGGAGSNKLLDIMDTLKQCDKFDGFVTLAEGTGLTQILKQDEPLTVFVPSNEALRKIPDEELEVIKNNSTALREFIMYHIVNGSYFSQDLKDGQQLPSILDMRPIQVGVRVDGCSRRLVEANTSPMRRPDIVAKNGVIHILDWYLTTRDNEWCDPIGRLADRPTTSSNRVATGAQAESASERLQQVASEPVPSSSLTPAGYATRMSGMVAANNGSSLPANHKLAATAAAAAIAPPDSSDTANSVVAPTAKFDAAAESQQTNSVYVSAVPVNELASIGHHHTP